MYILSKIRNFLKIQSYSEIELKGLKISKNFAYNIGTSVNISINLFLLAEFICLKSSSMSICLVSDPKKVVCRHNYDGVRLYFPCCEKGRLDSMRKVNVKESKSIPKSITGVFGHPADSEFVIRSTTYLAHGDSGDQ